VPALAPRGNLTYSGTGSLDKKSTASKVGSWVIVVAACGLVSAQLLNRPTHPTLPVREAKVGGTTDNSIRIDTWGCSTFDVMVFQAGSTMPSVDGCSDLDQGTRVVGPLEVRTDTHGIKFARIEVPGRGEMWTYFNHLAE
jgi:hypothetical protein